MTGAGSSGVSVLTRGHGADWHLCARSVASAGTFGEQCAYARLMSDESPLDEAERAALVARLDALLLRPGEVHTEDWEGYAPQHDAPPISLWFFEVAPDDRPNAQLESDDNWSR